MKFCERPWTFWYITDGNKGEVKNCSWFTYYKEAVCGNILSQSVDEIIESEVSRKIKDSILDGSFKYCDPQLCKFLANGNLPDMTKEEIDEIIKNKYPNEFNISYDVTCNHACPSCRNDYFCANEEYYTNVKEINEKMLPLYNKAKRISVNGAGEIFACKELIAMLKKLSPEREDFKFAIETNGALFDERHWGEISHLGRYHVRVMVTVNSFCDTTYRYLNGYANHVDKVIDNLKYISSLREKNVINEFHMSMIVQEANFRELPEYVERCLNEFNVDSVRIRGIMQFGMKTEEYWFKDVFNPAHPCYSEMKDILNNPIMKDERVWYWEGDYEAVRKPVQHPLNRFQMNYELLWKLMNKEKTGEIEEKFEFLREKKIAIYGWGHIAEYIVSLLNRMGIEIECIIDKRKLSICDVESRVVNRDLNINDINVVINAVPYYTEQIKCLLEEICYVGNYIEIDELI